jgi:hypothetical protein
MYVIGPAKAQKKANGKNKTVKTRSIAAKSGCNCLDGSVASSVQRLIVFAKG